MGAFDPKDPLPVFAGIPTYLRARSVEINQIPAGHVVVAGVTWDHTSPGINGARFGPKAIRDSSSYLGYHLQAAAAITTGLLEVGTLQPLRLTVDSPIADCGDLRVYPNDTRRTIAALEEQARLIAGRGATPVFLGGDRFISYPLWRGVATARAGPVAFLQISADLCLAHGEDRLWGRFWQGATNRCILDSDDPACPAMVWLGTSGFVPAADWDFACARKLPIITARKARAEGIAAAAQGALTLALANASHVYVSLDVGVVDGVYAPGTDCPHFGGFSNLELLELMDALAAAPVAAIDIVNVVPTVEMSITTQRLAAVALLRLLAGRLTA